MRPVAVPFSVLCLFLAATAGCGSDDAAPTDGAPDSTAEDSAAADTATADSVTVDDSSAPTDSGVAADTSGGTDAPAADVLETGTDAGPKEAAPVDAAPRDYMLVFVTSATYDGNLGGKAGADAKCQALATFAGISGTFVSIMNHDDTVEVTKPYKLTNGSVVWASDLTANPAVPIDVDEWGGKLGAASEVWTFSSLSGDDCGGWSSNAATAKARVGLTSATDIKWAIAYDQFCDRKARLYCFEK